MRSHGLRAVVIAAAAGATLALGSCSADPPDEALQSFVDLLQPDGAEVTLLQAKEWYKNIYGVPDCPDRSDVTKDCEITELLGSRQITQASGTKAERLDLDYSGDDRQVSVETADFTRPAVVSCFKVHQFRRVVHDLGTRSDSDTFEYPCYFLTPNDSWPEGYMAVHMGTLLSNGSIGLSPAEQCWIDFPSLEEVTMWSACHDKNEWVTAPAW